MSQGLRRVRLWVIASLAACAVAILLIPADGGGSLPTVYTVAVLAFAGASIVLHQMAARPGISPGRYAALVSLSYLAAAGVGVTGLVGAYTSGDHQTGLLFVAAGAIFALRPTRRVAARRRPR